MTEPPPLDSSTSIGARPSIKENQEAESSSSSPAVKEEQTTMLSTARYYTRLGLYLSCMGAIAAWGAAVAFVLSVSGNKYNVNWVVARSFYTVASKVIGIAAEVEGWDILDAVEEVGPNGEKKRKARIYMSNHQSMLDILFVARTMPRQTSILSKSSLKFSPLGPFMLMSGAIFIDRSNPKRAIQSLDDAGQLMKDRGIGLWMYPEGTRHLSPTPYMLPLKKGGFHLAVQAGIEIVPIVTEGYWRLYRKGIFNGGKVRIKVLPPISTQGLTPDDIPALSTRVREVMVAALEEMAGVPSTSGSSSQEAPLATVPSISAAAVPSLENTPITSPREEKTESLPKEKEETSIPSLDKEKTPVPDTTRLKRDASTTSIDSSNGSSESGSTEEDEGMVLVGRPS